MYWSFKNRVTSDGSFPTGLNFRRFRNPFYFTFSESENPHNHWRVSFRTICAAFVVGLRIRRRFECVLSPAHVRGAHYVCRCQHIRENLHDTAAHTTPAAVRPSRKSTPDGYRVSSRRRFACTCVNYRRRRTARKPLFPRAFPGSILRPVYTRRRRRLLVRFVKH